MKTITCVLVFVVCFLVGHTAEARHLDRHHLSRKAYHEQARSILHPRRDKLRPDFHSSSPADWRAASGSLPLEPLVSQPGVAYPLATATTLLDLIRSPKAVTGVSCWPTVDQSWTMERNLPHWEAPVTGF